jgi:uncharacterized protein
MMLIRTSLGVSDIHGVGTFAVDHIKKGVVIWRYVPNFDLSYTDEELEVLPKLAQEYIRFYGYESLKSKKLVLCADNGRFFNHDENPNTDEEYHDGDVEPLTVANRDIEPGEEITCHYATFDERGAP